MRFLAGNESQLSMLPNITLVSKVSLHYHDEVFIVGLNNFYNTIVLPPADGRAQKVLRIVHKNFACRCWRGQAREYDKCDDPHK